MKIIVFGASGSGTTTLGRSIAQHRHWQHLDVDDYYWKPTVPMFQEKVPLNLRNQKLIEAYEKYSDVVISGSLVTWGTFWNTAFDLGVFLYVPLATRIERLKKRELERYGPSFYEDPKTIKKSADFLAWASKYDDSTFQGRSIMQHRKWIDLLSCEVLEITGDLSNNDRLGLVKNYL